MITPGAEVGAWADRRTVHPTAGVTMAAAWTGALMVTRVHFAPGADFADHVHGAHDQIGTVLEGALTLRLGGERRELGPGDCYVVPRGTPHGGAAGPDGVLMLEAFSPVREDYRALVGG